MAKRCSTCRLILPLEAFSTRRAARDGLQNRCRSCWRDDYVANLAERKAAAAVTARAKLNEHRERLHRYLAEHPCVDCGEDDVRCLDFDHRDPSQKLANVSQLVATHVRWERIQAEIEKCDIRCANCHRKRTAEQQQSWRHQRWLSADDEGRAVAAVRLANLGPGRSAAHPVVGSTFRKVRPGVAVRL